MFPSYPNIIKGVIGVGNLLRVLRQNEEGAKQNRTDANSSPFPPSRPPNESSAFPRRRMFPSYPNIIEGLIGVGNLLRVLRQNEEVAKQK